MAYSTNEALVPGYVNKSTTFMPGGRWFILQYERNSKTSLIQVLVYETNLVLAVTKTNVVGAQKAQQKIFLRDSDVLRQAQIIDVTATHAEGLSHLQQIKQKGFQKLFSSQNHAMQPFIGQSMLLVQYNIGKEDVMYSIVDMHRIVMYRDHPQSATKAFVRADNEKLFPAVIARVSCDLNEMIAALHDLQISFCATYEHGGVALQPMVNLRERDEDQHAMAFIGSQPSQYYQMSPQATLRKKSSPIKGVTREVKQHEPPTPLEANETRVDHQNYTPPTRKVRKYTKRVHKDEHAKQLSQPSQMAQNKLGAELDKMLEKMNQEQKTLNQAFHVIGKTRRMLELRLDYVNSLPLKKSA